MNAKPGAHLPVASVTKLALRLDDLENKTELMSLKTVSLTVPYCQVLT
jgi:hypothetical protein